MASSSPPPSGRHADVDEEPAVTAQTGEPGREGRGGRLRPAPPPVAHAPLMLGIDTEGTPPEPPTALGETARRVHETFGCARVAITQRETLSASEHGWQAHFWDSTDGSLASSARYQVRLVDRVGGGDSFVAGLLHALLEGRPAADAVRFATAASALKLTIPGDFNRVTADEVERFLSTTR